MMKKFSRKVENFKCENCGFFVVGNGYTNHCPKCLYSKHVDVNPGDRKNLCQGLMKPTTLMVEHGENVIWHKCVLCGFEKKNKSVSQDDLFKIQT